MIRDSSKEAIAKAASMDLAAARDMLGVFSFPSAADQKSDARLGGTVQAFVKEVEYFFVDQGQVDRADPPSACGPQ